MPHGWLDKDLTNTFQVVIAANDEYSFIIYNYDSLTWPNRKIEKDTQAGYYLAALGEFMNLNESILNDVTAFAKGSNCDVNGKYIFRLNHSGNTFLSMLYIINDLRSVKNR